MSYSEWTSSGFTVIVSMSKLDKKNPGHVHISEEEARAGCFFCGGEFGSTLYKVENARIRLCYCSFECLPED